ncbi:MAG TPA: DinB family protein [Gemmatimonadales bacterium]|nr:DinB family protein [Gemmatimonadales bacterium]
MSDADQLAAELQAVFSGEPWHADALMAILAGISATQAGWRPRAGVHCILELVEHLTLWKHVVRARVDGDPMADANDRDWPTTAAQAEWSEALDRLVAAHHALVGRIRSLTDAELDALVPGRSIAMRQMLHGVIYHDVYHAGQIRLLQRMHEEAG